jgi:hypothetical protein
MKRITPSKSFSWLAVVLFYFLYLLVLIVGHSFHPWLDVSASGMSLRAAAFYLLPVVVAVYVFRRSQRSKLFIVSSALVVVPIFLILLNIFGLDVNRLSFAINWPVYALLADGSDNITIPRDTGEVFLGGGWSNYYVYDASGNWWNKYQEELQATNLAKRHTDVTFEIKDINNYRECRIVTPLIGHWYLEYKQYGGGFLPCAGIESR